MDDWKSGFKRQFGSKESTVEQEDVEDGASYLLDNLTSRVATMDPALSKVRIKEPCLPCAAMASTAIH